MWFDVLYQNMSSISLQVLHEIRQIKHYWEKASLWNEMLLYLMEPVLKCVSFNSTSQLKLCDSMKRSLDVSMRIPVKSTSIYWWFSCHDVLGWSANDISLWVFFPLGRGGWVGWVGCWLMLKLQDQFQSKDLNDSMQCIMNVSYFLCVSIISSQNDLKHISRLTVLYKILYVWMNNAAEYHISRDARDLRVHFGLWHQQQWCTQQIPLDFCGQQTSGSPFVNMD